MTDFNLYRYDAARVLAKIQHVSAFNVPGYSARWKLNQHAVLYVFPDGSRLKIRTSAQRADCWHPRWTGSFHDIHLAPIKGVPIRVNTTGA